MVLEQYYLGCLAHASYLIADQASGQAAVIDPQRDVEQHLDDAAASVNCPGGGQPPPSPVLGDALGLASR